MIDGTYDTQRGRSQNTTFGEASSRDPDTPFSLPVGLLLEVEVTVVRNLSLAGLDGFTGSVLGTFLRKLKRYDFVAGLIIRDQEAAFLDGDVGISEVALCVIQLEDDKAIGVCEIGSADHMGRDLTILTIGEEPDVVIIGFLHRFHPFCTARRAIELNYNAGDAL